MGKILFDKAEDGLFFRREGDTYTVVGADKKITQLNIPLELDGVAVTAIGPRAFEGCKKIRYLYLTGNITRIGERAFRKCASLESVSFSKSKCVRGEGVFEGCKKLTRVSVDGVEVLDIMFLSGMEYIESIHIASMVHTIEPYAISCCKKVKKVHFANAKNWEVNFSEHRSVVGVKIPFADLLDEEKTAELFCGKYSSAHWFRMDVLTDDGTASEPCKGER